MNVRPIKNRLVFNDGDFIFMHDRLYKAFFSPDNRKYMIMGEGNKGYIYIDPLEFINNFEIVNKCIDCGKEFVSEEYRLRCDKCESEAFSEYCEEVSLSYWAEEDEMKAGIHPSQLN